MSYQSRSITYRPVDEQAVEEVVLEQYGVPSQIRGWLDKRPGVLPKLAEALEIVAEHDDLSTQADIVEHHSEWSRSALATHLGSGGALHLLVRKCEGTYELTDRGREANRVDWTGVESMISDYRRR
jgi:hypothetical protein